MELIMLQDNNYHEFANNTIPVQTRTIVFFCYQDKVLLWSADEYLQCEELRVLIRVLYEYCVNKTIGVTNTISSAKHFFLISLLEFLQSWLNYQVRRRLMAI